jgi:hypothetical protein
VVGVRVVGEKLGDFEGIDVVGGAVGESVRFCGLFVGGDVLHMS